MSDDAWADEWWLRLRFVEGGWELMDQTQDGPVADRWDAQMDAKELRTGIDHEWIVHLPYGARLLPQSTKGWRS